MADNNMDFIIQCLEESIEADKVYELKDELDKDYKYLVGIAITDGKCSESAVLDVVKVKGSDVLPERFQVNHIRSSAAVAPNKRFFSWFKPVQVSGDEIVIRFQDPEYTADYSLQIQLLLTNNPEKVCDVLFA